MVVLGLSFRRMLVEKKENLGGKINISNNISITDVERKNLVIAKEQKEGLRFGFEFTSEYLFDKREAARISLSGDVLFMDSSKVIKEIEESWKKKKMIPVNLRTQVLSNALNKCHVQALLLSQEMNLPSPIPLPRLSEA